MGKAPRLKEIKLSGRICPYLNEALEIAVRSKDLRILKIEQLKGTGEIEIKKEKGGRDVKIMKGEFSRHIKVIEI